MRKEHDRTPLQLPQSGEWINALDAIRSVARTPLEDGTAREALLNRMREGSVECAAAIFLEEADIGAAYRNLDAWGETDLQRHSLQREKPYHFSADDGHLIVLPADFFSAADGWLIDPESASWSEGRLVARRSANIKARLKSKLAMAASHELPPPAAEMEQSLKVRRVVSGLMFKRESIGIGVNNGIPQTSSPLNRKGIGGRRRDPAWDNWIAELAAVIAEDGIDQLRTPAEIIDAVVASAKKRSVELPTAAAVARAAGAVAIRLSEVFAIDHGVGGRSAG